MTIDEAITFVENAADYDIYNDEQAKISENYRQIASMLRELKALRESKAVGIEEAYSQMAENAIEKYRRRQDE